MDTVTAYAPRTAARAAAAAPASAPASGETAPAEAALHTRWITDRAGLLALRPAWAALLADSAADTIFLTPEWTLAWLGAYATDEQDSRDQGSLRVLAVSRGTVLIGLALLARRRAGWRDWPARARLTFAADGSEDSDYLDLIARHGEEDAVVGTVMDALAESRVRGELLAWHEIPEDSPTLAALETRLDQDRWYCETQPVPCAEIALPDNWDAYLKMLKPRMRTKVRGLLKKADGDPAVCFERCRDAADLDARLPSLFALHQSRWTLRGREGIFADPAKRDFYARMSHAFLDRDWLRFYSLRVGGREVAHQFCFERGGVMFLLQEGFDKDWADRAVGNTLRALVLRDAIARGVGVYDFLAGVTPHKLSWGARTKASVRLLAAPPGLRAGVYFNSRRLGRWGKRHAKAVLIRTGLYTPPHGPARPGP